MSGTALSFTRLDTGVRDRAEQLANDIRSQHGRAIRVDLPSELATLVEALLREVAEAGAVLIASPNEEVSPEEASKILGVSRPMVVRRMDDGRLPFRYVGSHRRCRLEDVFKLKAEEDRVANLMQELYDEHSAFDADDDASETEAAPGRRSY